MWRRLVSPHLKILASAVSAAPQSGVVTTRPLAGQWNSSPSSSVLSRLYSAESASVKKVEDVMPIATGHEREEIEAEHEGRDIHEINHPVVPFGTKESPSVIKSYNDQRPVGCTGGEGEDQHYVEWFTLKKGILQECPKCSQYFVVSWKWWRGPPDDYADGERDHHY